MNVDGEMVEAKTVILATGVSSAKEIPGERELLGRGVSYCATCDGMLYRGKSAVVWGLSPEAAKEANFLQEIGVFRDVLSPLLLFGRALQSRFLIFPEQ